MHESLPNGPDQPSLEECITSRDRWLALAVSAIGSLVLLPGAFWGLPGGKTVCGALRAMEGQVPYRDFWTMYAPGQFYAVAGLFGLFGRECLVQSIAAVLISGAIGGALFLVVRRVGVKRRMAIVVSALIVGSFWRASPELTTYPAALLCALWAVGRVLCYFQQGGRGKLLVAGLLLGVAACFKHDVAFHVTAAIIVTLGASWLGTTGRRPSAWSRPLTAACTLAGGAVLIVLPAVLLLAWFAGKYAWHDLVVWPATDFRGVRTEPFPPLLPDWTTVRQWAGDWSDLRKARDAVTSQSAWIVCNIPQYVFAIGAGLLVFRRRRMAPARLAAAILCVAMLPLFWTAAHVQQNTHPYSMAIFSLCLMGMAWPRADAPAVRARVVRGVLIASVAIYAVGLLAHPAAHVGQVVMNWSGRRYFGLPGARGIWVAKRTYDVYHPITTFIRQHVPPAERIYVGLKRHDAPVIGDQRFYYLTGRKNCTRYDELHPGVTDRADVQDEIIDAIQQHRVRCVVLWQFGWPDTLLDKIKAANMAAVPGLGRKRLDAFIDETFEPVGRYGEYILMWREGAAGPKTPPTRPTTSGKAPNG